MHAHANLCHDREWLIDHLGWVLISKRIAVSHADRAHETLLVEPEDLDRAVRHACGQEVTSVAQGYAIDRAIRVQEINGADRGQLLGLVRESHLVAHLTVDVVLQLCFDFWEWNAWLDQVSLCLFVATRCY